MCPSPSSRYPPAELHTTLRSRRHPDGTTGPALPAAAGPLGRSRRAGDVGGELGPAPRLLPTRHTGPGPGVVARVPVAVWAVWDADDLVGAYAKESTARADAAILRRDAARAGHRGRSVDCLPLQVFTEPQHTRRDPRTSPSRPAR